MNQSCNYNQAPYTYHFGLVTASNRASAFTVLACFSFLCCQVRLRTFQNNFGLIVDLRFIFEVGRFVRSEGTHGRCAGAWPDTGSEQWLCTFHRQTGSCLHTLRAWGWAAGSATHVPWTLLGSTQKVHSALFAMFPTSLGQHHKRISDWFHVFTIDASCVEAIGERERHRAATFFSWFLVVAQSDTKNR